MSGHHRFPIFETCFGPFQDDTGFIVDMALEQAIVVVQQGIGTLQRLEAEHMRREAERQAENSRTREEAKQLVAPLYDDEPRRWPWVVFGLVVAFFLGWALGRNQDEIWNFFVSLGYPKWRWMLAAISSVTTVIATGIAINKLSNEATKRASVKWWIVAVLGSLIAFALVNPFPTETPTNPPPAAAPQL